MKQEGAGRSVMRLACVSAVAAVLAVLALGAAYEWRTREAFAQGARAEAESELGLLRSNLQGAIDAYGEVGRAMAGVLRYQHDIDQAEFEALGAELARGLPAIRNLAAAPGGVVTVVYPLQGNAAVKGLDLGALPGEAETVARARESGRSVLAGPLDLVQGGRGFVLRTPVLVPDPVMGGSRYWGLVTTVIDEQGLYRAGGLKNPGLPLEVALLGRDGRPGVGTEFYGDPKVLAQEPVTARVTLPSGTWEMVAVPKGGWPAPPPLWGARALFVLASLLVVTPIMAAAQLMAARQTKLALIREREAELSRLSWRLEFALAASNVGVWDVDLATDEMFWDERTKALFGFTGREGPFSEADWVSVVHPDDRAQAIATANEAVDGDGRFVFNYRVLRPDGTVRHVRDMAARYEGEDGARRLVGLVWDMTADVERQQELEVRRTEAEAATVAKSRFLAAMSHEIRTPMSGVLGLLGLMLDDPLPERQQERAKIALASAQSLLQILNDILDFSKLEAKQIKVCEENVDVRRLVQDVIELMAANAKQKGLGLGAEVAADVPERILADPMRLRQVLTNLLSNGTKFTERGEVRVQVGFRPLEGDEGLLEVEVQDTGIGISDEHMGKIFRDFVQADDSLSRRAGGTGLGLAICRQLVELMGGEIGVRSVPGIGSTFHFSVRVRRAAAVAEAGDARGNRRKLPPMRVLLAEDHATNQYLIGAYLGAAGHQVTVVQNGTEAIAAVARGGFDVVLMDVQMPEVDGLEATRRIRAAGAPTSDVPIIALTANAMPGDKQACLDAGMNGYLTKPIDVLALHQALQDFRPPPQARERTVVSLR